MSAAGKIHQLPLTPRELALQILNEIVENGGDTDDAVAAFVKAMEGKRGGLRPAEHREYFELVIDGQMPSVRKEPKPIPNDLEKEAQKLERQARRIRAAAQVDAVRRVLILELMSPDGEHLYGELSIGDFVKLGVRQKVFGEKLIKKGHKSNELLASATTNEALDTAINGR